MIVGAQVKRTHIRLPGPDTMRSSSARAVGLAERRRAHEQLGHPIYESAATDPLVQAVERAVRAGLVVVVAAGNFGTTPTTGLTGFGGIASPGNAPTAGGLQTCLTPIPSSSWNARRSTGGATAEAAAEGAAFQPAAGD